MKTVPSFTASIYVGTKPHYSGEPIVIDHARGFLQQYVDQGLCVTLTPTEFIYTKGKEPGFIVGLINYPRFPSSSEKLKEHAKQIALGLLTLYQQFKVSVVFPDETVMFEESDSL